ncbi:hypothetical protein [Cellulophaga sp. BC115SP]|uniref:hypothetical protein n=1 Tax=Cellulophaga sp. BC115SP TaxID=2683263 RepID=UPI00141372F3|nr:hypothetical protein [Cellulophaga sp. BC115SP]NBB31851.1 hypothetical protein [Cellulophaga sp. BC115SP]
MTKALATYFMTDRLNIEKLKIYNSYGGDIDGICRNNRPAEKAAFGDNFDSTWSLIANKLQDIELISKQLTSYDYTKNTLTELYENSDDETYNLFTDKIPFYNDFQKVKSILETIKNLIIDGTDTVWAGYDNGKEFLVDLNTDIEKIRFCDFETLDKLNMEFAQASTYQEISLSNGWANEYLKLAEQFDNLYKRLKSKQVIRNKKK